MARRSPLAAARGALVSMVLLMILMAAGIFGTTQAGGSWGAKLALDLSGGTQMILSPKVNGSNDTNVSQEQLKQAVEIIRQRVDGAGVSEAEVTTSFGSETTLWFRFLEISAQKPVSLFRHPPT